MNNIDRMTNNVLDYFNFKDNLPSTSTSVYKDIININKQPINNNNNLFKQDVDYLKRYNQAFDNVLNLSKHNESKESLHNIVKTNIINNNNYNNNNLFNNYDNLDEFKDLFYRSNKSNTSLNK
jgi:isocitrate dehydrogenase kinase/phosphatase